MPYKMSKNAKSLHKAITDGLDERTFTSWDFYYFCFTVGMSKIKLISDVKMIDFSNNIEEPYLSFRNEIIAALVSTEIERKGLEWNRDNVIFYFSKFTDSKEFLNQIGQERLNYYAEGGFQLIIEERPTLNNPIEFISVCRKIMDEGLPTNMDF